MFFDICFRTEFREKDLLGSRGFPGNFQFILVLFRFMFDNMFNSWHKGLQIKYNVGYKLYIQ